MTSLGSYLDTLGWVFFQKGQVSQAEPYLKAAFQLHRAPLIAEHLARVYAAQNNPNSAFRYYAFASRRPHPEPISSELESYIKERFGDPKSLDGELKEADESFRDDFRLELPGRTLTCPATPVKDLVRVTVELLVDETGAVVGAQAKAGDEPFRSAALQDARQAHFAPLVWPSHGLKTIRAVDFFYTARKTVSASWGFGTEFGVSSLLNRLNIESESPANAGSRVAKARRSDTVSSGLNNPARARTLEADSHFTLGAELEAKATVESQNAGNAARAKACEGGSSDALAEAAGRDFLAALDQYRLAHELEPANSSYKSAYDRLSRKLKQKSR